MILRNYLSKKILFLKYKNVKKWWLDTLNEKKSSYITKGILNFIYIALFIKLLGVENYGLFTVSESIFIF